MKPCLESAQLVTKYSIKLSGLYNKIFYQKPPNNTDTSKTFK